MMHISDANESISLASEAKRYMESIYDIMEIIYACKNVHWPPYLSNLLSCSLKSVAAALSLVCF